MLGLQIGGSRAGTQGTITAGTYLLTGIQSFGTTAVSEAQTLVLSVSGGLVTASSYEDLGSSTGYRWTATISPSNHSGYQYTCVTPDDGTYAVSTNVPFDYSVVSATTLWFDYTSGSNDGNGVRYVFTKQ